MPAGEQAAQRQPDLRFLTQQSLSHLGYRSVDYSL
jgi:hypothetical protein